jgi:predicted negative regulator of RcsB-dependent stress response
MSIYMTEEEQVELIKSWWKKYSNVILIVVSIILLTFSAIKYWTWHKENKVKQASMTYEQMMLSFANKDFKAVRSYSQDLIKGYKYNIYADAACLALAKIAITNEKYTNAKKFLNIVLMNSHSTLMKDIAKLRIARILLEEKDYLKALSETDTIKTKAYISIVNELKGDIYNALGKNNIAIKYYKKAASNITTASADNLFLEMKINKLIG